MIRKDKIETGYLSEMPLMLPIGVIRAMVVFPQSHHYPPQRGGTLVTAGRRPADIQSSTINHQPSIINPIAIANTPPQRLLNESSSLLIAEADEIPSESHQQRYGSFRAYGQVVPRVEVTLSRKL